MNRSATLLGLLLSASAATAQTPVPDTTAAWRYLPLVPGNVWEYTHWYETCPMFPICDTHVTGYEQRRVVGDSLVDGQTYAVLWTVWRSPNGGTSAGHMDLVRFDTLAAHGVLRQPGGTEVYWPSPAMPCPLGAPFDDAVACEDGGDAHVIRGAFMASEGGQPVEVAVKGFVRGGSGSAEFGRAFGLISEGFGDIGGGGLYLTYARVGPLSYGTSIVAGEGGAPPVALALRIEPNPVRERATLRLLTPMTDAVRVEVYDALGRRVAAADLGARAPGEHALALDVSGWAQGLYVVRAATAGGRVATARLVRAD